MQIILDKIISQLIAFLFVLFIDMINGEHKQCNNVNQSYVHPVSTIRDLGFHLNSVVTSTTHIAATVRNCFSILRQIQSVHLLLSRDALNIMLMRALIINNTAAQRLLSCWNV